MDATAVQAIGQLAITAANANKLPTPMPAIVIGNKLISLEHLEDGRSRFRGKLNTDSLADFMHYTKLPHTADGQPDVFIDAKKLSATAFFNLGDHTSPGHADHTATLKLEPTAAYTAVATCSGTRISQRELSEFIEEWSTQIVALDSNGDEIGNSLAISAVRSVTIKTAKESNSTVDNFRASRTAMEDIEAKASGLGQLPTTLQFTFCPALGLSDQTARIRVALLTGEEKPVFLLRWLGKEQVIEAIGQDFKRVLFDSLEDAASLTVGTFTP